MVIDTNKLAVLILKPRPIIMADCSIEITNPGGGIQEDSDSSKIVLGLDEICRRFLQNAVLGLKRRGILDYIAFVQDPGLQGFDAIEMQCSTCARFNHREISFNVNRWEYVFAPDKHQSFNSWIMMSKNRKGFDFCTLEAYYITIHNQGSFFSLDIAFQSFLDDICKIKLKEYENEAIKASNLKFPVKRGLETFMKRT
jgi:hypothetical protein